MVSRRRNTSNNKAVFSSLSISGVEIGVGGEVQGEGEGTHEVLLISEVTELDGERVEPVEEIDGKSAGVAGRARDGGGKGEGGST